MATVIACTRTGASPLYQHTIQTSPFADSRGVGTARVCGGSELQWADSIELRDISSSPKPAPTRPSGKADAPTVVALKRRIRDHDRDVTNFALDCRAYANQAARRYTYMPVRRWDDGSGTYRRPKRAPTSPLGRAIESYRERHPTALGSITRDRGLMRLLGVPMLERYENDHRDLRKAVKALRRTHLKAHRPQRGNRQSNRESLLVYRDLFASLNKTAEQLDRAKLHLTYQLTWRSFRRALAADLGRLLSCFRRA